MPSSIIARAAYHEPPIRLTTPAAALLALAAGLCRDCGARSERYRCGSCRAAAVAAARVRPSSKKGDEMTVIGCQECAGGQDGADLREWGQEPLLPTRSSRGGEGRAGPVTRKPVQTSTLLVRSERQRGAPTSLRAAATELRANLRIIPGEAVCLGEEDPLGPPSCDGAGHIGVASPNKGDPHTARCRPIVPASHTLSDPYDLPYDSSAVPLSPVPGVGAFRTSRASRDLPQVPLSPVAQAGLGQRPCPSHSRKPPNFLSAVPFLTTCCGPTLSGYWSSRDAAPTPHQHSGPSLPARPLR